MLKILTPIIFRRVTKILLPTSAIALPICLSAGLYYSLYNSPPDYQQGEMVRVMYVHVPAAWMSLLIYGFMAICSLICIVWQNRLAYLLSVAAAPIGATLAFVTLVTGSLWGKPIWGAWWVWDARLVSMLILFMFYLIYLAIINNGHSIFRAEKPASVVAIVGLVHIPIVKFSVNLWYSLHQPASILRAGGSAIDPTMLKPLLIMFVSFIWYFILLLIIRTKILLKKAKHNNL